MKNSVASSISNIMMHNKKSIALFIPSMTGGGAERVTLNLITAFCMQGWSVDLILNKADGRLLPFIPKDVRVFTLSASNFISKTYRLSKYLKNENPEFLISLLDRVNAAGCAKFITKSNTKVILSFHNTISQELLAEKTLFSQPKRLFMKLSCRLSDSIVAVSKGVAADLINTLDIAHEKVNVIYNPIVSLEIIEKSKMPVTHPWLHQREIPIFLSIGRLSPAKNFPDLLKAFALVRQKIEAKLLILGEGEERPKLENLICSLNIQEDVELHGFVDNPYPYIVNASSFVMSSKHEGLTSVLIEALALGKPIVSTDCPNGPSEILDEGKYGKLVPVGNLSALCNAMIESLSVNKDVEAMQARAKSFSVSSTIQQYINLLNSLHHPEN
jgi:glycosyltransferase involved in cell wall biosynthesis